MSVTTIADNQTFDDVVDAALGAIQEEINRTRQEKTAFEQFSDRVANICDRLSHSRAGVSEAASESTTATVIQPHPQSIPGPPNATTEIREAYESTVMSLSFFDEEYGETYTTSIQEEFGPEMATVLRTEECLTPVAQDSLLTRIREATQRREGFLQACERERCSVENVTSDLKPIHHALSSYDHIAIDQKDFGSLDAHRTNLRNFEHECEEAAEERQIDIDRHRTEFELTPGECDLPEYLYADLAYDYPVLYLCSTVSTKLRKTRNQVENAMVTTLE